MDPTTSRSVAGISLVFIRARLAFTNVSLANFTPSLRAIPNGVSACTYEW